MRTCTRGLVVILCAAVSAAGSRALAQDRNAHGTVLPGDGSVPSGGTWVGTGHWIEGEDAGGPTFVGSPSCWGNTFGFGEVALPGCPGASDVVAAPTYYFWSLPTGGVTCVQQPTGVSCSGTFEVRVYAKWGNFEGQVNSNPGGTPVGAGVLVRAYDPQTCAVRATTSTDSSGRYRFPKHPSAGPLNDARWGLPVQGDGGGNPARTRYSSGPGSATYVLSTGSCAQGTSATTQSSQIVTVDLLYPAPSPPPVPTIVFRTSPNPSGKLFTVAPSYTVRGVGIPSVFDFQVGVVDANTGLPMPNSTVTLTHDAVPNTGGHQHHAASRPAGRFSPASGSTGGTGWLDVRYTAPEVSGDISVRATCTSSAGACPPVQHTAEVRFCCLQPIPVGFPVGERPWHPSNHWGSADLGARLASAVVGYALLYPGSLLEVNDISLEWGGVFDIEQNWIPPHVAHRWGDNVDLPLGPPGRRRNLRALLNGLGFTVYEHQPPDPPHFHLSVQ